MGQYRDSTYTIADENNWKIGMCPKGYSFVIKRSDNSDVCSLFNGLTPMDKSLARLLSATPDMYKALQFVQSAWDENRLLTSDEAFAVRSALLKIHGNA